MQLDWFPLWLSLRVAALSTVLALATGLWLAWILVHREFRGREVVDAAVTLPLVLPPTVLGYYLLVLLGRGTIIGHIYESIFGGPLVFTWQAAVVAAFFHSAPLLVKSARAALESIDHSYERAARNLGASEWRLFWKVSLPLARRSIGAAAAIAFARSLGDFGVTIMIAGNIPGRTQTVAVAIYDAVEAGNGSAARVLVVLVSAIALAILTLSNVLDRRRPSGRAMIHVRIRKRFPEGRESGEFSLDVDSIAKAGVTVLFGPSGSGKTLTLEAIAGFIRPDEGRILLDDEILFDGAARVNLPPQRRNCGYVFQNYALFPHMTLRANLEFAAVRWRGLERHRRVGEMLERFRLAGVAGRKPHELSGGQKQRCSIARALIGEPRLLLLDEPARGLDLLLRQDLYDVLQQVREEFSTPILLVTHDLDECFTLGDEMIVLRQGRIVQAGPPRQVFEKPANLDVARLLATYNAMNVEIRALDPQNKSSRIVFGENELEGPYYPGHFRGDRVVVCPRPGELWAFPGNGRRGPNQVAAVLMRGTEFPDAIRLEFEGGLVVDVPLARLSRAEWERVRKEREWTIEFPPQSLRIL